MDTAKLDAACEMMDALGKRCDAWFGRKDADGGGSGNLGRKRLYPAYTTAEMKKWLTEKQFDPEKKAAIEGEILARESGESKPYVVPQVENPGSKPTTKLGRM